MRDRNGAVKPGLGHWFLFRNYTIPRTTRELQLHFHQFAHRAAHKPNSTRKKRVLFGLYSDRIGNGKDRNVFILFELLRQALCRFVVQQLIDGVFGDDLAEHDDQRLPVGELIRLCPDMVVEDLVEIAVIGHIVDERSVRIQRLDFCFQLHRFLLIAADVVQLDIFKATADRAVDGFEKRAAEGLHGKDDLSAFISAAASSSLPIVSSFATAE